MKRRFSATLLLALLAGALAAAAASAAMIGIYRNSMDTNVQRGQMVKLFGRSCARGGGDSVLKVTIGKETDSCAYRTPVLGRDLEIAASERLLSGTPPALARKSYLSVQLRAGAGAKYQLLAFPLQRKVQLLRVTAEGSKFLAISKNQAAVKGLNEPNVLRLRAVNITKGPERGQSQLFGYIGQTLVVEAKDEGAGELTGRASAVGVGASGKSATGLIASIDDVVVRVPSPF